MIDFDAALPEQAELNDEYIVSLRTDIENLKAEIARLEYNSNNKKTIFFRKSVK